MYQVDMESLITGVTSDPGDIYQDNMEWKCLLGLRPLPVLHILEESTLSVPLSVTQFSLLSYVALLVSLFTI